MLSFKLWRALQNPPRHHPLYQHVLSRASKDTSRLAMGFFMWAFMFATFIFIFGIIFDWLLYIVLGLFILINTVYALRWVLRIASSLVQEKEQNRYDLLATLPIGSLGTSWAISTGCVHERASFRFIPHLILAIAIVTFFMLCGLTFLLAFFLESSGAETTLLANLDVVQLGLSSIPFVIVFYFDHIYSILTAVLFGQWITIDLNNPDEARVRAFLGYLALQLSVYALSYSLSVLLIPSLLGSMGLMGIPVLIGVGLFGIAFFLCLRELIVRFLWQRLVQTYLADENETMLVLKPYYEVEAILKASQTARLRAAEHG
jgi:hypothetical protein